MTALSADKARVRRLSAYDMCHEWGVSASTAVYKGSLMVLNGGYAEPGTTATGLVAVGVAQTSAAATAGDGSVSVEIAQGIFRFANSASADLIAADDRGALCYIVDDDTVALTDGTSTRSVAGIIYDVDAAGNVFVLVGLGLQS